jgi:hypothetical protein
MTRSLAALLEVLAASPAVLTATPKGRLRVDRPVGWLTPELEAALREHREELLFLAQQAAEIDGRPLDAAAVRLWLRVGEAGASAYRAAGAVIEEVA